MSIVYVVYPHNIYPLGKPLKRTTKEGISIEKVVVQESDIVAMLLNPQKAKLLPELTAQRKELMQNRCVMNVINVLEWYVKCTCSVIVAIRNRKPSPYCPKSTQICKMP